MSYLAALTKKVRVIVSRDGFALRFSRHASERMMERRISRPDVVRVLRTGRVTDDQGDDRLRVTGRDVDGDQIDVIIVLLADEIRIEVVTVLR